LAVKGHFRVPIFIERVIEVAEAMIGDIADFRLQNAYLEGEENRKRREQLGPLR
jgi:hypothetical protein